MTGRRLVDGTLCLVGAPEKPLPAAAFNLLLPRKQFAGSGIGGIGSKVEVIPIQRINEAHDRLVKGDVKYRFMIDVASLRS